MLNLLIKNKKAIIILFIIYLALRPTIFVTTGISRLFPTFTLILFFIFGLISCSSIKKARMNVLFICFALYIILNAIFTESTYGNKFITIIRSTFWIWAYCVSFTLFSNSIADSKKYQRWVASVSIIMMSIFYICHSLRLTDLGEETGDNIIFYSLMLTPWISLIQNKRIKWLLIALLSLCILLSLKRSSTIIIVSSIAIMYVSDFLLKNKIKISTILSGLLIIICLIGVLNVASDKVAIVTQRFESIESDGGNGRNTIYEDVYQRYISSSFDEKIFGHGFDGVRRDSSYIVPVSAHNDFLEVLYDFGVIGLVFYILMHLSLIKWAFHLFSAHSQLAVPVLISYICFFIMSMVSHLILYPTYFGLLTSFWAYAECKDKELKYKKLI